MTLEFEPITLARQDEYNHRFDACLQAASDYTFTNLWGWAEEHDLSWAWDEELVWIKQGHPATCLWAPVGDWQQVDWPSRLAPLRDGAPIARVPEKLVAIWEAAGLTAKSITESREHWDYLYKSRELIRLKGNRFHKKKNLIKQFENLYNFRYRPMKESLLDRSLLMQQDWCIWKNCEASAGLTAENRVIERILQEWPQLKRLSGGVLLVENEVAAFTVGELVRPDTLVIHIEKGLGNFKGIYQAINKYFLEATPQALLVNREQDLGDEGLRNAKLSYQPIDFIKKFTVVL